MNKIIIVAFGLMISSSVIAKPHVGAYWEGLDRCIDKMNDAYPHAGLGLTKTHLSDVQDEERTYYLNGSRWADGGGRVAVAAACTTDVQGSVVVNFDTVDGRFVRRDMDSNDIAYQPN